MRRQLAIAVLACSSALAGSAAPALAAEDSLFASPAGAGDCSSAATACSIAAAVTAANAKPITDSVRIRLASGTYVLPSPSPTALPITFAGPSLTIEPESGTATLNGGDAVRLLSVSAASNVTIDGLRLESGLTSALGGAIQNTGTLTVKHSTFSSNKAANGGAITNEVSATLAVEDSTFSHNTATGVGGGAIINFGTATVARSAIVDNHAPTNGGGVNIQPNGVLNLSHSTVTGNSVGGLGGALSNLGTLTIQGSTIIDNTASGGAALATGNANVTVAASIIASHSATPACNPANTAFTDGGYNLDDDGTCISALTPATGSHSGTTAYGSSTYAAALEAYLADAVADNGGPTETLALLNAPDPATTVANPAFDLVPPSFALPFALGGVSAACSLPDQRGVVPVAGANCAIGAYLLQATSTAVTAPAAVAGQDVTLAATVTPAADGGTVAFDDGSGNPATTQCAAQPVSSGAATCTVSYASAGGYPVTATYSGDGAGNHYAPSSASAPQTVEVTMPAEPAPVAPAPPAPARDRTPPATTLRRISSAKQPITLRGTGADDGSVRYIRVSVARHVSGKQCRFLQADHTFAKPRTCNATSYMDAKGTASWSLKLPTLPRGRYTIWTRAVDVAGNVELKNRGRNLLVIRIPRKAAKPAA